jgi:hypothetical protein
MVDVALAFAPTLTPDQTPRNPTYSTLFMTDALRRYPSRSESLFTPVEIITPRTCDAQNSSTEQKPLVVSARNQVTAT